MEDPKIFWLRFNYLEGEAKSFFFKEIESESKYAKQIIEILTRRFGMLSGRDQRMNTYDSPAQNPAASVMQCVLEFEDLNTKVTRGNLMHAQEVPRKHQELVL